MKRPSTLLSAAGAALGLVLSLGLAPAANAEEAIQNGPDPTQSTVEALRGAYSVAKENVSDFSTSGFGSATIWYPGNPRPGEKYGVVAVSPGFTAGEATIAWYGPRLASQGFVVITINTQGRLDQPFQRATQLLAALDHVQNKAGAPVQAIADHSRQAVMGHSMGGGGSLEAAKKRPSIKATIPLTPWNLDTTWPEVNAPTLIIGAQSDIIAPHMLHAEPFYRGLPRTTPKAYLELGVVGHLAPLTDNTPIASASIAWLKTYVDGDTRYKKFVCPQVPRNLAVLKYETNCGNL